MIGQLNDLEVGRSGLNCVDFIYGHVREYDFHGSLLSVIW